MKSLLTLSAVASAVILTACAAPRMHGLPPQEPGKAALTLYSSTLNYGSTFDLFINNHRAGDIEGGQVHLVYLNPGRHTIQVNVSRYTAPLTKSISVQAGRNYFINVYSTANTGRAKQVTFHIDNVSQADAMSYLNKKPSIYDLNLHF